jgi:hypothetical protein
MTTRVVAIGKGIFFGWLLGSLIGISVAITIGTIGMALGNSETTIGLGPIPIVTAWSNQTGSGFEGGWGVSLFTIAGMIVGAVLAIRPRPSPANA